MSGAAAGRRGRHSGPVSSDPLLTDLYQLTMLQAYLAEGMLDTAVFELFVRRLPAQRRFLVAAGIGVLLDWLEDLHFSADDLDWLARDRRFDRRLLDALAELHFSGDVDALPEGTVCFADEPIVRVSAPIVQAQLIETRLLNLMQFQTVVASKAARCVLAADGRRLVDFGLRRAHAGEAGLLAARAAWLAGFDATSAVAAARWFDIPLAGTMAHSYVQAHRREHDAFLQFARSHPRGLTLLIDTYDTEAAARQLAEVLPAWRREGIELSAVRIDSGDLAAHARAVRAIFDAAGLPEVQVFASGGLDESAIQRLLAEHAPIDGFGVGTALVTSEDAPALDCAYKLVAYAGEPCRKRSEGKATWPGAKQVWRRHDDDGMPHDVVGLLDETLPGTPLLQPMMRDGRRIERDSLAQARQRCAGQLAALPGPLRTLDAGPAPVQAEVSAAVRALADRLDRQPH